MLMWRTMVNMALALPKELHQPMRRHPEIKWSKVARRAMQDYAEGAQEKLTPQEQQECQQEGWRRHLDFADTLQQYKKPVPIKDALGKGLPIGRLLHGYPLTEQQKARILTLAKDLGALPSHA